MNNTKQSEKSEEELCATLKKILTAPSNVDDIESILVENYNFVKNIIKNYPNIINSLHIDCERWYGITSFIHLMIYFNTNASIRLMYYAYQSGYPINPRLTILDNNNNFLEVDILAIYLRENPPAVTTPYRVDVMLFLLSNGCDLNNANYKGVNSKTMIELYRSGVESID